MRKKLPEIEIPDRFHPRHYAAAFGKSAGWWCMQIGNRLFLQAALRSGQEAIFQELFERLAADPFADLEFRYKNASDADLGSHLISTVTPLTFGKAKLIAEMQDRLCANDKDPCDDTLARAADHAENTDLLGFTSTAHVLIDLKSTDKQILKDFKLFLTRHRRKPYCPSPIKPEFSTATLDKRWFGHRVLPHFDLLIWAESAGVDLGPTKIGEWLCVTLGEYGGGQTGINAKDYCYGTLRPSYDLAFDPATYQALYTLSQKT